MSNIHRKVAKIMPELGIKLKQAKMDQTPQEYVHKNFFMSFFLGMALCFIIFMFIQNFLVFLFFPIAFLFGFFYFMRYVDLKIEKIKKEISREIIYAGRFLIIELESGVPIYDAFRNIRDNYEYIGKYFGELVSDVNFGTSLEDAIDIAITTSPSPDLRKILWQVLNSLRTGADVKSSLNAVLDQIVREQEIAVKEYGRKLNPIAMFYMMASIIGPSLGTTMIVVLATFIGFSMSLTVLLIMAGAIGFVQMMFLFFIKSARPPMSF